jgi:aspartate racemase
MTSMVSAVNQLSFGGVEEFDNNVPHISDIFSKDLLAGKEEQKACVVAEVPTATASTSLPTVMKHPHREQVKLIGILGGVGPMAGVHVQQKIIKATQKANTDQQHLSTLHFCCPSYIGDRTRWLLSSDKSAPNPGDGMFEVARTMSIAANAMGMSAVVGVPCNTFHSDAIFAQFLHRIDEWNCQHGYSEHSPGHLKVLHMIELTLKHIKAEGSTKVGLLATSGTRETFLYESIAEVMGGVEIVHVAQDQQESVQDSIYNTTDGIKAISRGCDRVVESLTHHVHTLVEEQGAQAVILGCTELPLALPQKSLAGVRLIDPMDVLAEALVAEAIGIKTN